MFEYELPFHIQEEIMERLPVKSLVQFRSVSKAWKSLIDNSEFIAAHCLHRHAHQQHLLVSYKDSYLMEEKNDVCYIDDDTFLQQRSIPALPLSVKQVMEKRVIGSSHGLLCFYGLDPNYRTGMAVVWNPSIRKSVIVVVPGKPDEVGFGVCHVTGDPKIVSITEGWDESIYRREVMVYTLSLGKWRTLSTNLLINRWFWALCSMVVTDGFIYWHEGVQERKMIMSFDVTNESFEVIDLPNSVAILYISKVRESLAIFQYSENNYDVWMMEHGVQRLFTKLFTIKTPYEIKIVGFRKNSVPIMEVTNDDDRRSKLVVYEPNSEHNNVIGISGSSYTFRVTSYMETLLLLGRSDCISY